MSHTNNFTCSVEGLAHDDADYAHSVFEKLAEFAQESMICVNPRVTLLMKMELDAPHADAEEADQADQAEQAYAAAKNLAALKKSADFVVTEGSELPSEQQNNVPDAVFFFSFGVFATCLIWAIGKDIRLPPLTTATAASFFQHHATNILKATAQIF